MKKVIKKDVSGKTQRTGIDAGISSSGASVSKSIPFMPLGSKKEKPQLYDELAVPVKPKGKLKHVDNWDEILALEPGTTVKFTGSVAEMRSD